MASLLFACSAEVTIDRTTAPTTTSASTAATGGGDVGAGGHGGSAGGFGGSAGGSAPACVVYADDFDKPDGDLAGSPLDAPADASWFLPATSDVLLLVSQAVVGADGSPFSPTNEVYQGRPLAYEGLRLRLAFRYEGAGMNAGRAYLAVNAPTDVAGADGLRIVYRTWGGGQLVLGDADEIATVDGLAPFLTPGTPYYVEAVLDANAQATVSLTQDDYASAGGQLVDPSATASLVFATQNSDAFIQLRADSQSPAPIDAISVERCPPP